MFRLGKRIFLAACLLCFAAAGIHSRELQDRALDYELSSSGKPLVKRPPGRAHKTILSLEGGGLRVILSSVVLIEVEQSIKRYLLSQPHFLPAHANITTVDDFDINLVDYFDCIAGLSGGAWAVLYLASRGGQGASRAVLDDPAIVKKYGAIPTGGAEGLRVLFKEYGPRMFPFDAIDPAAGTPFDLANPNAPGVLAPLYALDGIELSLEAFLGNTTLADLDTSVLVPILDLISGYGVFFVQNKFKMPVTASAILQERDMIRDPANGPFQSDFVFSEGKDYYLRDIGVGSGALPLGLPAKNISQVGSDVVEFIAVDGGIPVETPSLPATLFVASETGSETIENIAMLSLGSGVLEVDLSYLANAGATGWLAENTLSGTFLRTDQTSLAALVDYIFYSNPKIKPYQLLRIQTSASASSEEGLVLSNASNAALLDELEAIGHRVAAEYRDPIDTFVRDFIF